MNNEELKTISNTELLKQLFNITKQIDDIDKLNNYPRTARGIHITELIPKEI